MSDLWHVDVPDAFIDRVFDEMEQVDRHVYQVLTKRSERMRRYLNRRYSDRRAPAHIWVGVSIESDGFAWRADDLRRANLTTRFISAEPLLGPLEAVDLAGIDWLIAGGESGRGARPMDLAWVRDLRDRCAARGVAFFLKQLGGETKKRGGSEAVVDGRRWTQYPAVHG